MELEIWDGGLQEQEINAIKKIEATFCDPKAQSKNQQGGKSFKDQLQQISKPVAKSGMYPWKGYAGFRFVDAKGKEGEFDLVIVTHCNVIIVELKDWNHEPVTSQSDIWFKGDKNMGRSPVSVTRNKKFLLDKKLQKLGSQFSNKKFLPRVNFFVVMTGNADFSALPEADLQHTISLNDFLQFGNKKKFNEYFRPHPIEQVLNLDFPVFNKLFSTEKTTPKSFRVSGYTATEEIFQHPKLVYKEYLASSELSKSSTALLRLWNFKNLSGSKAATSQGRAEIVSREREVLHYIQHKDRDLYNHCLRSLTSFDRDDVTSQHSEVYELPPGHVRFNEFIGKYGQSLSQVDRLNVVKLLLAKFAHLHEIKIAHRDIADHSLWISPSKEIALSNFISAYHQPIGTVGDYRSSLSVGAAEIIEMLDGSPLSPFQQDVHALGILAWHLLNAERISPKSLESAQDRMLASGEWYAPILLKAATAKYKNAKDFFDALMDAQPQNEIVPTFDHSELDVYRRSIGHSRQYKDDGTFIIDNEDKEVYLSDGRLVKAWLKVGAEGSDLVSSFHVLSFLKRVTKLASVNPPYLPRIYEFGLASKSSSMYLVTDFIEGIKWSELFEYDVDLNSLIDQLIAAVEHLHGLGLSHGDIHPKNVIVRAEDSHLFLIDIPDFSHDTSEPKNHRYSPEHIDSSSALQRDVFAVLKMSCELLGLDWGQDSDQHPRIAAAVQAELADPEFGFKDLRRFKNAIASERKVRQLAYIDVYLSNYDGPLSILPDNGRLYVKFENAKKSSDQLLVTFFGIGGAFSAFYDRKQTRFVGGVPPRELSSISPRVIEESHLEISTGIRVSQGKPSQLFQLTEHLQQDESFQRALISFVSSQDNTANVINVEPLLAAFEQTSPIESTNNTDEPTKTSTDISTRALWRAILDTETESSPHIELVGAPLSPEESDSDRILPYESDIDPLGEFASTDEIDALLISDDGTEKKIGEVVLNKSALNEVRLSRVSSSARALKDGDTVFFRSKQDRASYRKRKLALERLIDRESILPDLMDLFDPACEKEAVNYDIEVSDADFARYDREDQHGNKISLNEQQREAFEKLVNFGPLSLLQGPPGTGKTEFIAAFVHFLIEKLDVRRILLVSQSHEAVNTAAERIRKHCSRLGTSLEVVRFSNREGAVSQGLKDVYSQALTTEKRELFNAEYRFRVATLADSLGLDAEFIVKVVDAELKLFNKIDQFESLTKKLERSEDNDDKKVLKKIAIDLDETIRSMLRSDFDFVLPADKSVSDAKETLFTSLCNDYGIKPNEARRVRALAKISGDMRNALSAVRVNCDEFYARSRQLVTGTCVGIGQTHIGIQNNVYDFVIIDEAARSISSELAIAMQSAKRVLLVGDHLQLPPLYSDAHKAALARRLGVSGDLDELEVVLKSDFARAFNSVYGVQASATLLTQYRMAPPIGDLVSHTFYDGKLQNGSRPIPDFYKSGPAFLKSPVAWLDTSTAGKRAHHEKDSGPSIYNRCEAEQIIEVLKQVASSTDFLAEFMRLRENDEPLIGVICMYAEQKRLIRKKFNQENWVEGFKELVKIDTVDSYQGKENRIIIVSLTRSEPKKAPGFLRTPNRINVAMSRAMDRLLIVGNVEMWNKQNSATPLGQVFSYMSKKGEPAGYKFLAIKSK